MSRERARLLLAVLQAVPPDALRRNRVGILVRMHGHVLAEEAFSLDDVAGVPFATALGLYGTLVGAEWIVPHLLPHSDLLEASGILGPLAEPERLHPLLVNALRATTAADGRAPERPGRRGK